MATESAVAVRSDVVTVGSGEEEEGARKNKPNSFKITKVIKSRPPSLDGDDSRELVDSDTEHSNTESYLESSAANTHINTDIQHIQHIQHAATNIQVNPRLNVISSCLNDLPTEVASTRTSTSGILDPIPSTSGGRSPTPMSGPPTPVGGDCDPPLTIAPLTSLKDAATSPVGVDMNISPPISVSCLQQSQSDGSSESSNCSQTRLQSSGLHSPDTVSNGEVTIQQHLGMVNTWVEDTVSREVDTIQGDSQMRHTLTPYNPNHEPIITRIDQAINLVKSHLMINVRTEVEKLKSKISRLETTLDSLSRENRLLRSIVSPEQLSELGLPPNPPGST